METTLKFLVPAPLHSLWAAVGMPMEGMAFDACPLMVGDTIISPGSPGVAFRVASRCFRCEWRDFPPMWILTMEQAETPTGAMLGVDSGPSQGGPARG